MRKIYTYVARDGRVVDLSALLESRSKEYVVAKAGRLGRAAALERAIDAMKAAGEMPEAGAICGRELFGGK